MTAPVIDSSIIIDYLLARPSAVEFIERSVGRARLRTTTVVQGEMLQGARNRVELREIDGLLRLFRIDRTRDVDFETAIPLLRAHRLAHGIGWPDCLIAATCMRLPLATLHDKHFRCVRGLKVLRPY